MIYSDLVLTIPIIYRYECNLRDIYFYTCFTHVASSVVGITVALSLVYLKQYLPCYGILVMFMVQLLVYCMLGTILTLKNEDLIMLLYDINWYMLEKQEKRHLLLMLHRSQNFVELSVGGLTPMNMVTFLAVTIFHDYVTLVRIILYELLIFQVMKRIYSFFMMLVNFVN